jgi:hypothetical protein
MLSEAVTGATIEDHNRRSRIKAIAGIDGTQQTMDNAIRRLQDLKLCKIPISNQHDRREFMEGLKLLQSEIISTGMMIDEYASVLESIWEDYDKSSSTRMN